MNTKFYLVPISTKNDSNVLFYLIRSNETFNNRLEVIRKLAKEIAPLEVFGGDFILEQNVVLVSGENYRVEKDILTLREKLINQYDDECVKEVSLSNEEFEEFLNNKTYLNWNEDLKFTFGKESFLMTDEFETDFISSFLIDYAELK